MRRLIRRQPSAATVIALVALGVALGGSAYAASQISGSQIRNRTITWRNIALHSIGPGEVARLTGQNVRKGAMGGYQVDSTTLAKVPSAATADSATTSGGLAPKKFLVKLAPGAAQQPVLQTGSLTLLAACSAAGVPTLSAASAVAHAELVTSNTGIAATGNANGSRNADLSPGATFPVDQGHGSGSGVVTYANPNNEVATVTFGFAQAPTFGGTSTGCAVWGTSLDG